MDWEKERDALIAQTVEFVQSVTGRKPDFAMSPAQPAAPAQVVAPEVKIPSPILESPDPVEPAPQHVDAAEPPHPVSRKAAEPHNVPDAAVQTYVLPQIDIRKEIRNRISAFQAHQNRFHRDRDAYFKSVLEKARTGAEHNRVPQVESDEH